MKTYSKVDKFMYQSDNIDWNDIEANHFNEQELKYLYKYINPNCFKLYDINIDHLILLWENDNVYYRNNMYRLCDLMTQFRTVEEDNNKYHDVYQQIFNYFLDTTDYVPIMRNEFDAVYLLKHLDILIDYWDNHINFRLSCVNNEDNCLAMGNNLLGFMGCQFKPNKKMYTEKLNKMLLFILENADKYGVTNQLGYYLSRYILYYCMYPNDIITPDIPYKYMPSENTILRQLCSIEQLITFINIYNKFWDKTATIQYIKKAKAKRFIYHDVKTNYTAILRNVNFYNPEVKDWLVSQIMLETLQ